MTGKRQFSTKVSTARLCRCFRSLALGFHGKLPPCQLRPAGVEAVIPAKSNRRTPIPHDREKYRWRNLFGPAIRSSAQRAGLFVAVDGRHEISLSDGRTTYDQVQVTVR